VISSDDYRCNKTNNSTPWEEIQLRLVPLSFRTYFLAQVKYEIVIRDVLYCGFAVIL